MKMKLNGWQRLWIVACGIYFIAAASYVVMHFPQPADIPHSEELYLQLKPESFRKIAVVPTTTDLHFVPDAPTPDKAASSSSMFTFTSPEGAYQVTGPAGSTVGQAFGILQRKLGSKSSSGPWKYQAQSQENSGEPSLKNVPAKSEINDRQELEDLRRLDRLERALTDADKAGDTAAAKTFAAEIRTLRAWIAASSTARPVLTDDEVTEIETPNGQQIPFSKELAAEEVRRVVSEYSDLLNARANHERVNLILRVFALWLFPCLLIYGLGWSVGWVYRGFRKTT